MTKKSAETASGKWIQRVPPALHKRLAERAKEEGVSLNMLCATLLAHEVGRRDGQSQVLAQLLHAALQRGEIASTTASVSAPPAKPKQKRVREKQ